MEKIYTDPKGKAVFRCPHCGFERSFDASAYRNRDSRIRIKCQCGQSVPVLIEFREYYRKSVNLYGLCHLPRTGEAFQIVVKNLSLQGAGFEVVPRPGVGGSPLLDGDIIAIEFNLDNAAGHLIKRKAIVININGLYSGVRFAKSEYDKELGFYLMQ